MEAVLCRAVHYRGDKVGGKWGVGDGGGNGADRGSAQIGSITDIFGGGDDEDEDEGKGRGGGGGGGGHEGRDDDQGGIEMMPNMKVENNPMASRAGTAPPSNNSGGRAAKRQANARFSSPAPKATNPQAQMRKTSHARGEGDDEEKEGGDRKTLKKGNDRGSQQPARVVSARL